MAASSGARAAASSAAGRAGSVNSHSTKRTVCVRAASVVRLHWGRGRSRAGSGSQCGERANAPQKDGVVCPRPRNTRQCSKHTLLAWGVCVVPKEEMPNNGQCPGNVPLVNVCFLGIRKTKKSCQKDKKNPPGGNSTTGGICGKLSEEWGGNPEKKLWKIVE